MQNINEMGSGALAFVGDAVYSLLVREKLAAVNRPSGVLHVLSVKYVRAGAQAAAMKELLPLLSETELSVYKRGRNLHAGHSPKNATEAEYHAATGLEALFGYLHLCGETNRLRELFEKAWLCTEASE